MSEGDNPSGAGGAGLFWSREDRRPADARTPRNKEFWCTDGGREGDRDGVWPDGDARLPAVALMLRLRLSVDTDLAFRAASRDALNEVLDHRQGRSPARAAALRVLPFPDSSVDSLARSSGPCDLRPLRRIAAAGGDGFRSI